MKDLLIARNTRSIVNNYLSNPGAPILISGPPGSGKKTLAKFIAARLVKHSNLSSSVFLVDRADDKQDISIEQIRQVTKFLRLRTVGKAAIRRAVLILDAQNMNEEAQNALLKILEEPPNDTLIILTGSSEQSLMPTIISRCKRIVVYPVLLADANSFYSGIPARDIESAWRISQGYVGLLSAILDDSDHTLKKSVLEVKRFLMLPKYEKLVYLDTNIKTKEQCGLFLQALNLSLTALHHIAVNRAENKKAGMLLCSRKVVVYLGKCFKANVALKSVFDELVLNLDF